MRRRDTPIHARQRATRRAPLPATLLLVLACGEPRSTGTGNTHVAETGSIPGTTGSGSSATGAVTTANDGTSDGPRLDILEEYEGIPTTCDKASVGEMSVGCRFYPVDLDNNAGNDDQQYAVVVSNAQADQVAHVRFESKQSGTWEEVETEAAVDPMGLHVFRTPTDWHQERTGIHRGGAYRITADVPIIAYQFNPGFTDSRVFSSDATVLFPAAAFDEQNMVVQHGFSSGAYVTIAAAHDGTQVTVSAAASIAGGGGIAPIAAGGRTVIDLDEGDVVELRTDDNDHGNLTGTRINTNPGHPVAVFSGHECANVPALIETGSCDHLEHQVTGLRMWGTEFIASRVAPRAAAPEPTFWQVAASEDGTTVTFTADSAVEFLDVMRQPLRLSEVSLDAGELLEFLSTGPAEQPGDFSILADQPIAVMNYMTGQSLLPEGDDKRGDPAMVQVPPTAQFLDRYVVFVPERFDEDFVVLTRQSGVDILLNGASVGNDGWAVVPGGFEVGRFPVGDGVHRLESSAGFGVTVTGWRAADSYAYIGGTRTAIINDVG